MQEYYKFMQFKVSEKEKQKIKELAREYSDITKSPMNISEFIRRAIFNLDIDRVREWHTANRDKRKAGGSRNIIMAFRVTDDEKKDIISFIKKIKKKDEFSNMDISKFVRACIFSYDLEKVKEIYKTNLI